MASEFIKIIKNWIDTFAPIKSRRRKLIHYIVLPFFFLFVIYLIADMIVMPLVVRHGTEFRLPDIVEMNIEDARELLAMEDLSLEITSEEYHHDKPEGTILSQYPITGTKVKAGRIVKVVASIGQKDVNIPEVTGISVRQAKLNIEAADLVLGDIAYTFTDSLPERVVVFAYPRSGQDVPIGTPINLMVNRGSLNTVTYMPRVIGLSLDEARVKIDDAGLIIGLTKFVTNENYLPETVLEQSVEAATELEMGEEIDLVVSTTE